MFKRVQVNSRPNPGWPGRLFFFFFFFFQKFIKFYQRPSKRPNGRTECENYSNDGPRRVIVRGARADVRDTPSPYIGKAEHCSPCDGGQTATDALGRVAAEVCRRRSDAVK